MQKINGNRFNLRANDQERITVEVAAVEPKHPVTYARDGDSYEPA
jgi:hypothetical protein